MYDEARLYQALALARQGMLLGDGGPFGAVIVRHGEVVATGWNRVIADTDPTAHAEMVAIRRAAARLGHYHLSGCLLYTSCEPCPMCLAAAHWAQLERIYYAATGEDAEKIGFADQLIRQQFHGPPEAQTIPLSNHLREEGRILFADYAQIEGRVGY